MTLSDNSNKIYPTGIWEETQDSLLKLTRPKEDSYLIFNNDDQPYESHMISARRTNSNEKLNLGDKSVVPTEIEEEKKTESP